MWSESRLVAKTATVSMYGNTYEVDAALVGRRVELVFDPFDLTRIQVRYQGRGMGAAIGHQIGRHVHPAAKPETSPDPAPPTGIDYLALVHDRHTTALRVAPVNYSTLTQHAQDITKPVGTAGITDTEASGGTSLDAGLEAELASFATLPPTTPTITDEGVIPGQLNLLPRLHPNHDDSQEHS